MPLTQLELFATPHVVSELRSDGAMLLRSAEPLGDALPSMAHALRRGAAAHPARLLASQRDGGGWEGISWGEAARASAGLAQSLLDNGLSGDRPLMVLSGNSIEHLLVTLGAFQAGVPVVPVSTAYSLLSRDHERLRWIAGLCRPGLVFADDAAAYRSALDDLRSLVPLQAVSRGDRERAIRLDEM